MEIIRKSKKGFMDFPESEIAIYDLKLSMGVPVYTTRLASELGKYTEGQIVDSKLGELKIESVAHYEETDSHPLSRSLTQEQLDLIDGPYDVIKISRIPKSKSGCACCG